MLAFLATIAWFAKRVVWFVWDNKRVVLPIIGAVVLLVLVVFAYRGCSRSAPKLDEKQIQEAQRAIAENDRKVMERVLVESEVAEKAIDANLANAENEKLQAIQEARKKAAGMSNEELANALNERARAEGW